MPNSIKYLRYALKGIQLDKTVIDSAVTSISYLHMSNALIQNGFIKESEKYIRKSLEYDSSNIFSQYVYAYILLAQHKDFNRTKKTLSKVLAFDTTRLDVMQELAKMYYTLEEYDSALIYYQKFVTDRERYGLNIFIHENLKIGFVYDQMGNNEAARTFYQSHKAYTDADQSLYKELNLSAHHAVMGNIEEAIEHLKAFSNKTGYQYWFVLFLKDDPIINLMSGHPEFDQIMQQIESGFWEEHRRIRAILEEESVL